MRYISTRGGAPALSFDEVLLAGLASDGGLYVPEAWPRIAPGDRKAMAGLDYAELAGRVMAPYVDGAIAEEDFAQILAETYAAFDHPEVAPLVPLGENEFLLELFHGPTLAFKDFALQLVGRLFDHVLAKRGERITIIGATSGDTGSAAIEACRDRDAIEIFILHPKGRVSEVQRRQNDCQDLVKALFNDAAFRAEIAVSAVNSINWARIMAQIVYYIWAAGRPALAGRTPVFAVPTGNFGNVFAGYAARQMGLPIANLVVGSNRNDILTRFFQRGEMHIRDVHPTLSPSMDIQISSNFERLLYDLYDRDGGAVAEIMQTFRETGTMRIEPDRWRKALELFSGHRLDTTGLLVDPHTAVGIHAGRAHGARADAPVVALATAHPAKFPDAVEAATGIRPALPERLADLFDRDERFDVLPNDVDRVRDHIRAAVGVAGAA